MGQKNFKGAVSISNANGRIRLRWRYQSQRYSISLYQYNKANLLQAKKTALQIEQDISNNQFDQSLNRYTGKIDVKKPGNTSIVEHFEEWTKLYRQMDCEKNTHYNALRGTLRKWEEFNEKNALSKLNGETFGAKTYNDRLPGKSTQIDPLIPA